MNSPPDETIRLVALSATGLLQTPDDYAHDCAVNIGSRLFDMPVCLLNLAGAEPRWPKSCLPLDVNESTAISLFCRRVVDAGEPVIVEDALSDLRFLDNPVILNAPRIRFFAGYPIRAASGVVLGTLCLINFEAAQFPSEHVQLLRELASLTELGLFAGRIGTAQRALVAKLDVARRESLVDPLLRIWNRGGIMTIIDQLHKISIGSRLPFSILMVDVDHFKKINDRHGHIVGDTVLKAIARSLQASVRADDGLGRYGGEEFIAVLPNTNAANATELARRLNKAVAELRIETLRGPVGCTVSIGVAEWAHTRLESVQGLVHRADAALLQAKKHGRNRVLVGQQAA